MDLQNYLAVAAVLAVVVGVSILTVGASTLVSNMENAFFKPKGMNSPPQNRLFHIEVANSNTVRTSLRRFPSLTLVLYLTSLLCFLFPLALAMAYHVIEGVELSDLIENFGKVPGPFWRALPMLSLSSVVAYALFLLFFLLRMKRRCVRILALGRQD